MPRGKKMDKQMIANIITSYTLTNNYNATAKELGISANTVKNIINKQKEENPEEYAKVCEEKKEEFSTKANKIIDKALELLERRYNKALKNEDELEELIAEASLMDKDDLSYQEKLAIIRKIGKIELNSLSEITTSMGTLYDKMRLANGESTSNISASVSYEEALKEIVDDDDY